MNILIDNVSTINKGAELMLYAVLQELERSHPDANVFFPLFGIPEGVSYLKTTMNCRQRKIPTAAKFFRKIKGDAVLRRFFHIPYSYTTNEYPIKELDLVLDAGGFRFTDQFSKSNVNMMILNNYYKTMKKRGVKIVFLPQAFGPFNTNNGKQQAGLLREYADCIIAREEESYTHLINAGIDNKKILLYPDFTALVDGKIPLKFEHLKNGIAIIPNLRILDKGAISINDYVDILIKAINIFKTTDRTVFFLNHEGKGDLKLCEDINKKLNEKLPIVTGLTALEVKGLLSQCYFVFTSRFHGLASALSTGVPALATSWSHKYEMLFRDYDMEGCVLDLNNKDLFYQKLEQLIDVEYNTVIRKRLSAKSENIKYKNIEMWRHLWALMV
jgi:colanic acid/amylovoran biosynthesis protein